MEWLVLWVGCSGDPIFFSSKKNGNEHEEMRARVSNNCVTIQQLIWIPLFRCSRYYRYFVREQPIFNIIKYQMEIKCPRVLRLFTTQQYEWRDARYTFGFYRISVLECKRFHFFHGQFLFLTCISCTNPFTHNNKEFGNRITSNGRNLNKICAKIWCKM